ncbi:putative solute/hydrogen antiporter [Gordonia effusa NBRC 100432]|uniref:Putative solute/hydrogen antiporter n=1 Tax=Gordonia effusa NBRC 100432 TaxID=1077974 RepID=H0QUT2_9ACTN|nr:cation:proton antiporter [Gordonia effusa]GAB16583.1 putative solute/hydrogen antiporter [Gordonia effusa NBRC 100432]
MDFITYAVIGVLIVAAANALGPKLALAPALILVPVGVAISFLPFVSAVEVDPEWILVGVLPPLLYSAAVSMPTMNFRRDFTAISGLSVLLVILSAVVLGFLMSLLIPGVNLATGIALGAIISPTDAVATQMVKKLGAPPRVVAVLEGESLLNDATALVMLRAAVAAMAGGISFGGIALDFVWAVVAAVVVGLVVGGANLWLRARITNPTVNTAISFTVPYLAYLPTEHVHASGLVAAVTAGLVTGRGAAKFFKPNHRVSDAQNWRTIELILEGGVFFLMGLELWGLIGDVREEHNSAIAALWVGLVALAVTLAVRAAFVVPLLAGLARSARRGESIKPRLQDLGERLTPTDGEPAQLPMRKAFGRRGKEDEVRSHSPEQVARFSFRVNRKLADIEYYLSAPLGPKEASLVVWAGMRGVVTVAAAQTLPADTPSRSLLVLTAFTAAAASLLIQGGTLPFVTRALRLPDTSAEEAEERERLHLEMRQTAQRAISESGYLDTIPGLRERFGAFLRTAEQEDDQEQHLTPLARENFVKARLAMIEGQRGELLRLRDEGVYSAAVLTAELAILDAEEISLRMRTEE